MSDYNCTDVEFHDNINKISGKITFGDLNEFEVESIFDVLFSRTDVDVVIRGVKFTPKSVQSIFRHNDCMVNSHMDNFNE